MEDLFAPGQGHRWTATAASGYTTTGIATGGEIYGTGPRAPFRSACSKRVEFYSTQFSPRRTPIAARFERLQPPFMAQR